VENVQNLQPLQHVRSPGAKGGFIVKRAPGFSAQAIGTLNVYTSSPHSFSNEEVRILSAFAELSAIALEKARFTSESWTWKNNAAAKSSRHRLLAAEWRTKYAIHSRSLKMLFHHWISDSPPTPRARDMEIMSQKMDLMNKIVEQCRFRAQHRTETRAVNLNRLIQDLGLLTRHKLKNQNIQLEEHLDPNCRSSWPMPHSSSRPF